MNFVSRKCNFLKEEKENTRHVTAGMLKSLQMRIRYLSSAFHDWTVRLDAECVAMIIFMTCMVSLSGFVLVTCDVLDYRHDVLDFVNQTLENTMGFDEHRAMHWTLHILYLPVLTEVVLCFLTAMILVSRSLSVPLVCQWVVVVVSSCIYVGLFFAEVLLLRSMKVHVIDVDLLSTKGLLSTLWRQIQLGQAGSFLPNSSSNDERLIRIAMVILSVAVIIVLVAAKHLSRRYPQRTRRCLVRYHCWNWLIAFIFVMILYFSSLSSMEWQIHCNVLPFNAVFKSMMTNNEVIHIGTNNLEYPPPQCPMTNSKSNNHGIDGNLDNSKLFNVVLLTQETWPLSYWTDTAVSHHLRSFITLLSKERESHQCIEFKHHLSLSRTTEMAHFALYYSLYQMYLDPMQNEHIASHPMQYLRECLNFETAYFSADGPWMFPNGFLIDGHFDNVTRQAYASSWLKDDWMLPHIESWLKEREKANPFLLHHHIYSNQVERVSNALNISRPTPSISDHAVVRQINADENKLIFLQTVDRMLDQEMNNTAFIFTNDHGKRTGTTDGYWSTDKLESPFIICLPIEVADGMDINTDAMMPTTSHIDVLPTLLELLGVDTDSMTYSHGTPIWKNGRWNQHIRDREFLYFVPRFFPKKAKVLGIRHVATQRTLHFVVENKQFEVRYLFVADEKNEVVCNHQQLLQELAPRDQCSTAIWKRAILQFKSGEILRKFIV